LTKGAHSTAVTLGGIITFVIFRADRLLQMEIQSSRSFKSETLRTTIGSQVLFAANIGRAPTKACQF
jgi:hypothetical protein